MAPLNQTIIPSNPTLVNSVENGLLYSSGTAENPVLVAHVYGTPYEMGFAHGQLLGDRIKVMYPQFMEWLFSQINPYLKDMPPLLREAIETLGIDAGLDLTYEWTRAYTPAHFIEEFRGIADGAGISFAEVVRFHMFPELIKASCSMLGAWGEASPGYSLLQLRALDWGLDNPMQFNPLLLVYHPSVEGHPFAIQTFTGFVGAITGYSGSNAISEKVWYEYKGASSRVGYPWHFLLRDILQFDENLEASIARINGARRTCSIWVGLGSHADSQFRAIGYSHTTATVYNDTSAFPGYAPTPAQHPLFPGLVYIDKHTQPSDDPCMGNLMTQYHGSLNPVNIMSVVQQFQTGDLQAAVYDFQNNVIYIAVATQTGGYPPKKTTVPAYARREWIAYNMTQLFAQQQ